MTGRNSPGELQGTLSGSATTEGRVEVRSTVLNTGHGQNNPEPLVGGQLRGGIRREDREAP